MWVTPEQITKAKSVDLLSYLEQYEPDSLVRLGTKTYCTKEHDSLKISNGLWHWFSRNIGGKNALDYLIKVKGFSFLDAVNLLCDEIPVLSHLAVKKPIIKKLEKPLLNDSTDRAESYLRLRGISQSVIDYCISNSLLAEDAEYHNCIFFGFDGEKPKYGALRSTQTDFKRELSGSDKRFSFFIPANCETDTVHLFESAIDLLSFATFEIKAYMNWQQDDLLSLGGVYKTDNRQDIPLALNHYLETHQKTKTLYLHLDNDEIGRAATEQIIDALKTDYTVIDVPPRYGKDINDELQIQIKKERNDYER